MILLRIRYCRCDLRAGIANRVVTCERISCIIAVETLLKIVSWIYVGISRRAGAGEEGE